MGSQWVSARAAAPAGVVAGESGADRFDQWKVRQ